MTKLMTFAYESYAELYRAERWSLTTRDHQVYLLVTGGADRSWALQFLQVKDGVALPADSDLHFCETPFGGGPQVAMAPAGNFMAWESDMGFKARNLLTGETHYVQHQFLEEEALGFAVTDDYSYIAHMTADNEFLYTTTIQLISGFEFEDTNGDNEICSIIVKFSKYDWATKTSTVLSEQTELEKSDFQGLFSLDFACKDGRVMVHQGQRCIFSTKLQHPRPLPTIWYEHECVENEPALRKVHFQNQDGTTDTFVFRPTEDDTVELHRGA